MKSKQPKTPTTNEPPAAPRPGLPVTLGQLVATPGALAALTRDDILTAVGRHARGDWGDCDAADAAENDFSLTRQLRLFISLPRGRRREVLGHHGGRSVGDDGPAAGGVLSPA